MVRKDRAPNAGRCCSLAFLIGVLIAAGGTHPHAQGPAALASSMPAGTGPTTETSRTVSAGNWPRLQLLDPVGSYMARQALDVARERLGRIDCAEILNTFMDRTGHPLDERLRTLAVDRQTYLTLIFFVDGSREVPCMKGSFAFTTPGSRVVRICVEELKRTWHTSPEHVVSRIIHEMLHTLGLGEDPPSSAEITRRVVASCGRR
jgi:hypothetical protein